MFAKRRVLIGVVCCALVYAGCDLIGGDEGTPERPCPAYDYEASLWESVTTITPMIDGMTAEEERECFRQALRHAYLMSQLNPDWQLNLTSVEPYQELTVQWATAADPAIVVATVRFQLGTGSIPFFGGHFSVRGTHPRRGGFTSQGGSWGLVDLGGFNLERNAIRIQGTEVWQTHADVPFDKTGTRID